MCFFFFFNDPSTTEIYTYLHTLSLTDACPISFGRGHGARRGEGPCRRTARGVELRDRLGGIARRRLYGDPRSADTPYPSRTTWRRRASGRQMARGAARSPFGDVPRAAERSGSCALEARFHGHLRPDTRGAQARCRKGCRRAGRETQAFPTRKGSMQGKR